MSLPLHVNFGGYNQQRNSSNCWLKTGKFSKLLTFNDEENCMLS